MSWRSPRRRRTRTSADFQNFLMDEGSKETKLSSFRRVRPLASRREPGGGKILELGSYSYCQRSLFTPSSLVQCVVTVLTVAAAAIRLGLDVAASLMSAVAAAAITWFSRTLVPAVLRLRHSLLRGASRLPRCRFQVYFSKFELFADLAPPLSTRSASRFIALTAQQQYCKHIRSEAEAYSVY